MLIERYFELLQAKIVEIAADIEPIHRAAAICADSLARGGAIHIYDTGHLVSQELVRRAGGLVAFSPLRFSLSVDNPVLNRAPATTPADLSWIGHIFGRDQLRPGDVMIAGSVSGKSAIVVELALQARQHGLTVIALTAVAYSSHLASEHPSGKRLFEAADMVLDNHAPYGDALLPVEGLAQAADEGGAICPASGLGAATVLWAVTAGIVEELLARGLTPTVYPSVNLPDGPERVRRVESLARERGL